MSSCAAQCHYLNDFPFFFLVSFYFTFLDYLSGIALAHRLSHNSLPHNLKILLLNSNQGVASNMVLVPRSLNIWLRVVG